MGMLWILGPEKEDTQDVKNSIVQIHCDLLWLSRVSVFLQVLQKMKDIIQHYAAIVDEKLAREEKQAQLDFTSAWVRGLPSSPPPSQIGQVPASRFTPRKDSQPHVATSRIPAPVVHGKNRV